MSCDCRNIENLINTYAERIDAGDFAGVGDLFRHGCIEAAPGLLYEGAEAVTGLYEATTRLHANGTPLTHHVTTNVAVEMGEAATTATARSRYTVFQQTDELPLQAIIAGRYHDTFHLVEGEWCFERRQMFVDLTGDLGHHLNIEL